MKKIIILFFLVLGVSCSQYTKALKNPDIDVRFNYAVNLYKNEKYLKALSLFEGLYRDAYATEKGIEIMYYLAYCYYGVSNYGIASSQFSEFSSTYPNNQYAEECDYMSAYCAYLLSPEFNKTAEATERAIEQLQYYVDKYPDSDRVSECNDLIDELRIKIEKKYLDIALFYLETEDYKASAHAFRVLLDMYPGSDYIEKIYYGITKSDIFLSLYSVESKKEGRLVTARKSFARFQKKYPDSDYSRELQGDYKKIKQE